MENGLNLEDVYSGKIFDQILDVEGGKKFLDIVNHRIFFLKDTSVSSRVFNLWRNSGLIDLPNNVSSRKWIKLNFTDYTWLCIVKDLRLFGIPFETIKKIKKILIPNASSFISENIDENKMRAGVIKALMTKENLSQRAAEKIIDEIFAESKHSTVSKLIANQFKNGYTFLSLSLALYTITGIDSTLLLYIKDDQVSHSLSNEKGAAKLINADALSDLEFYFWMDSHSKTIPGAEKDYQSLLEKPHLALRLSHYITSFIEDKGHFNKSKQIGLLKPEEIKLLEFVREHKSSHISITKNDGKIENISLTKYSTPDIETKLLRTFGKNEYANIEYKVANGKIISFKKTTKHKLKI